MKFIKFNDWLNKINEETREERAQRELEAKRREDIFMKHMDLHNRNTERATPEEVKKYIFGESPSQEFVDSVCNNVEKKTNFSYMYDLPDNPKGEADGNRILELVHDCFHDGTSEEEATNMVIDLLRQMKYVK